MSNSSSIIKEGFVQRYKAGFLISNKWKSNYAILYSDSTLAFYNNRGDARPVETVFLKNVVPYTCVGFMCDRMPVRRPSLPPGIAVQRLVGIGMDPQASKVHWILFPSEQILEEWMNAILSTLPKPPQNPSQNVPQQPTIPPAKYPDAPPPYPPTTQMTTQQSQQIPYGARPQYPQQQQPYYPPQQPQTVIIDRTSTAYAQPSATSTFGTGLAAGAGGALLGSLLGYGIGSMFAPHGGWGSGGWGYGGNGFGGGYIQDNDTYITNNYYIYDDNNQSSTPVVSDVTDSTDYSNPEITDYNSGGTYDYDGGGTWDSGGGFDSGDW